MKTVYTVTYQVSGEEIKSLGVFNSMDAVKNAIGVNVLGGTFDVDVCYFWADELEKLSSDINYQLATLYINDERLFYSERGVEYRVHEWHFDDDFTIESDMFEIIHLEVLPSDEIHESIGIVKDRSYCSDIIIGCEKNRRAKNGELMNIKDMMDLRWGMNLVIEDRDYFLFADGDVCYCIVTHEFKNDK